MLNIQSYKLEEKNQILGNSGELFDLFFSEENDNFICVVKKKDGGQALVDSDLVYMFEDGSDEESNAITELYEQN
tara:strand:+ start:300 stop:524 length:225 start_codon:yes stop_codon:yes gene_type:complete